MLFYPPTLVGMNPARGYAITSHFLIIIPRQWE